MPLDAVCLSGVVGELRQEVIGLRIEKIQQPTRDQVVLTLRGNRKLLLSAASGQARIHFTTIARENPASPPMLCMLLRKHLGGGRILEVEQPMGERVVILHVQMVDELGETGLRKLVLECMGRNTNLILLDGQERIIDCLRRVDFEMSPERQVLPGLFYHLPPAQEKANARTVSTEEFNASLQHQPQEQSMARFLQEQCAGLSPLLCRELAYRASGDVEGRLLTAADGQRLWDVFSAWQQQTLIPTMLIKDGKPMDFTYGAIDQYGDTVRNQVCDSFSSLLDDFYEKRERAEHSKQRGQELYRITTNARDRLSRKLLMQEQEYEKTRQRDTLRVYGELITANLYRMERGQSSLAAQDYYREDCPTVTIPLDPLLTPQQNAARYFKQYQKAKTAEGILLEQMQLARQERDWLESVLDELSRAEQEADFLDIRQELQAAGYLKNNEGRKELRRGSSKPRRFISSAGLEISVGRSNQQNDQLTKAARANDIWFHTQRIHGSHVILHTGGEVPDEVSMTEAALLAAWFSQGRESGQVAVDYTQAKHVKKPAGSKPGMVVYERYQTAYVTPTEADVKALEPQK